MLTVVTWSSAGQDGDRWGVYAQRYNSGGVAQGPEFLVNTITERDQYRPSAAMDSLGNFVIAWGGLGTGSSTEIFAQRYDSDGSRQGTEFVVSTNLLGNRDRPSVAMDADGDFVIVWNALTQDPDLSQGIYAQRYDATGLPRGGEFRVNTNIEKTQKSPSIAVTPNGDFVVAWQANFVDSGSSYGIYAQRFDATGAMQGGEF